MHDYTVMFYSVRRAVHVVPLVLDAAVLEVLEPRAVISAYVNT